jgi:hypothetical protein
MPEPRLGEWFCRHGRCAVRAVLLRLRGGGAPPPPRCPLCLRALTFGGWLAGGPSGGRGKKGRASGGARPRRPGRRGEPGGPPHPPQGASNAL